MSQTAMARPRLLLESFPTPPSFIPPSPIPSSPLNPPPSGPPCSPLPPVPGPSRISEHDARLILSSSRRSSVASSHSSHSKLSHSHRRQLEMDRNSMEDEGESISRISMYDLPSLDEEDTPQELHMRLRASRSHSEGHKKRLRARSQSGSQQPSSPDTTSQEHRKELPQDSQPPLLDASNLQKKELFMTRKHSLPSTRPSPPEVNSGHSRRPSSPDISTLLSRTPRPKHSASSLLSSRASQSATSLAYDYNHEEEWEEDFIEDYGTRISSRFSVSEVADGGSDSDSSLDLHTPLPHFMLRKGLLSPNSKLLARPDSVYSTHSNFSTTSVATKSGIIKDERDTPRRRVRHRDGRNLRGGIGLTTGLGWSDSEDEDAPSPLTRRISGLNLSRSQSSTDLPRSPASIRSRTRSSLGPRRSTSSNLRTSIRARTNSLGVSMSSASSSDGVPPTPIDIPSVPTLPSMPVDKKLPSLPNPRTGSIRYGNNTRGKVVLSTLKPLQLPNSLKSPSPSVEFNSSMSTPSPRPRTGTGMVYRSGGVRAGSGRF